MYVNIGVLVFCGVFHFISPLRMAQALKKVEACGAVRESNKLRLQPKLRQSCLLSSNRSAHCYQFKALLRRTELVPEAGDQYICVFFVLLSYQLGF